MYRIFNVLIESNIPLPELPEIQAGTPSFFFVLQAPSSEAGLQPQWIHHWRDHDDQITISCGRIGDAYLLRFPDLADFYIARQGTAIECYPAAGTSGESIRHLLLDQVMPRSIAQQGAIVLHASVVLIGGKAVAFLGDSGWGKSTLATSLHEKGYPLLTDDCVMLTQHAGTLNCIPGYAGARLWPDSLAHIAPQQRGLTAVSHYSSKQRLAMPETEHLPDQEIQLGALFVLNDPAQSTMAEKVTSEPVSGVAAIMELTRHSFHLDISDRKVLAMQFDALGQRVKAGLPMYRLSYPRRHVLLGEVQRVITGITLHDSTGSDRT